MLSHKGVSSSITDLFKLSRFTHDNLSINAGAFIVEVVATGPAATVGLKPGDVIVQIGTHTVTEVADFADALLVLSPGEVVPVSVYRGKEQLTIRVMLGEAQIL